MNRKLEAELVQKYGKERPLDAALSYIHEQRVNIDKTLHLIDKLESTQGMPLVWDMLRLSLDPSYVKDVLVRTPAVGVGSEL